jgi:hypothetical protein
MGNDCRYDRNDRQTSRRWHGCIHIHVYLYVAIARFTYGARIAVACICHECINFVRNNRALPPPPQTSKRNKFIELSQFILEEHTFLVAPRSLHQKSKRPH